jgi:enoyl-CoA hydratase
MAIRLERSDAIATIVMDRPQARNAVDGAAARALAEAFREFEADETLLAAVLWGAGGVFCAGADLKARGTERGLRLAPEGDGPMGPTRMAFTKPTIAAVEGYAVAGGLELALICDLRVAGDTAVFGVFNRRWGVPLIDGGTVRLPRMIGLSRALDMILTGRPVDAREALAFGLANRVVPAGQARQEAETLARTIAAFPAHGVRGDRRSAWESLGVPVPAAMASEFAIGQTTIASGESQTGARRFAAGAGRHGDF